MGYIHLNRPSRPSPVHPRQQIVENLATNHNLMHYNALHRNIFVSNFWNVCSRQRIVIRYKPLYEAPIGEALRSPDVADQLYRTYHRDDLLMT